MPISNAFVRAEKHWGLVLCVIVVAAILVRIYWAFGLEPKDGAEFTKVAYEMSQGTFEYDRYEGPPVIPLRTGIVLPTAAALALLGTGEYQISIYPLFTSVVILLLIYFLTARMFGHQAARIASVVWVFLPSDIGMATNVYTEIPATAFAFLGIYCIFVARNLETSGNTARLWYGFVGGLAFGVSWLCKESAVYFAPFCMALIVFDLRRTQFRQIATWGGVAAGSLAVLIGEMITYQAINGDLFYRFHAIHRNYEMYPEYFFTEGARFGYEVGIPFWKAVIKRIFIDGPAIIFLNLDFLYLPAFGVVAALYGWYRRDSRFYFMAGLFLVLIVMFNAFSSSLQHYQPLPLFVRYFYVICVPAVILTAGMLVELMRSFSLGSALRERPEPIFWGALFGVLLVLITSWSTFRQLRDHKGTWSAAERHLSGVVSPEDRIHADIMTRNALEFFWKYPEEMHVQVYGEPGQDITVRCGEYVMRNLSYSAWLTTNYGTWLALHGYELPEKVRTPPENWQVEWTNENATLFKVTCAE